ncbi:RNA ligase/cyclic nucleotide phosphodiesterase [Nemania serpens]|nr:RNA ligase/cyclic nucleotide phosphodiesterase [Nemania serpens]
MCFFFSYTKSALTREKPFLKVSDALHLSTCKGANRCHRPIWDLPFFSKVAAALLCHTNLIMSSALLEAGRVSDPVLVSEECLRKFNNDGTAKLYPGTTVLCHLRPRIPSHLAFSKRLITFLAGTFPEQSDKYHATLPQESWHVTLLDLTVYDPETMRDCNPLDARASDMSKFRQGFLEIERELRQHLPIRLKVDLGEDRYPVHGRTLQIPLTAYDDDEMHKLSSLRKALADKFGLSLKDGYKFHLTTHYQVGGMSEDQFSVFRQSWVSGIRSLAENLEALEISSIELCEFDDMTRFDLTAWVSADADGTIAGGSP